jgi:cytochrome c oxidase accessory protein FixG
MFDKDTLIITYDQARGEPRGKNTVKGKTEGLGDCVDCNICVQVCPTGIDIRDGLQYQCIGCAACIDGCNQVMEKVGRPKDLIRYSTTHAMEGGKTRILRARVLVYSAVLAVIVLAACTSLYLRVPLKVDVIRDRAALARDVEGGQVENVYRLQVMNTSESAREFEIAVAGVPTLQLATEPRIRLEGTESRMVPVRLRADPARAGAGTHKIQFSVRALDDDRVTVAEKSVFIVR